MTPAELRQHLVGLTEHSDLRLAVAAQGALDCLADLPAARRQRAWRRAVLGRTARALRTLRTTIGGAG